MGGMLILDHVTPACPWKCIAQGYHSYMASIGYGNRMVIVFVSRRIINREILIFSKLFLVLFFLSNVHDVPVSNFLIHNGDHSSREFYFFKNPSDQDTMELLSLISFFIVISGKIYSLFFH